MFLQVNNISNMSAFDDAEDEDLRLLNELTRLLIEMDRNKATEQYCILRVWVLRVLIHRTPKIPQRF